MDMLFVRGDGVILVNFVVLLSLFFVVFMNPLPGFSTISGVSYIFR